MNDLEKALSDIEEALQSGEGNWASQELMGLLKKRIPREFGVRAANIARRIEKPEWALRILSPAMKTSPRVKIVPSDIEKAEYAAALIACGALTEALRILESVKKSQLPEVLLFKSFAYISEWNYPAAIPLLKSYVELKDISIYQKLVGKINLAASYLFEENYEETENLLKKIVLISTENNFQRISGNAFLLFAEMCIKKAKAAPAQEYLQKAKSIFSAFKTVDAFLIQKWESFWVLEFQGWKKALPLLNKVREEAPKFHNWEALRDCDYYEAVATQNQELLRKVYYGTPFENFRKLRFKDSKFASSSYEWVLGGKSKAQFLDIETGKNSASNLYLKPGQRMQKLLAALCRDFYKPKTLVALYFQVFTGSHAYNPFSSPQLMYQAIKRLRRWFHQTGLPLKLEEKGGRYTLVGSCRLIMGSPLGTHPKINHFCAEIKNAFGEREFCAQEVSRKLKIPLRTAQRRLTQAVKEALLEPLGKGPHCCYRVFH